MVTLISRAVGAMVILGLAAIGAETIYLRILSWKEGFDANTQRTNS